MMFATFEAMTLGYSWLFFHASWPQDFTADALTAEAIALRIGRISNPVEISRYEPSWLVRCRCGAYRHKYFHCPYIS